jgi:hypothetical protein
MIKQISLRKLGGMIQADENLNYKEILTGELSKNMVNKTVCRF